MVRNGGKWWEMVSYGEKWWESEDAMKLERGMSDEQIKASQGGDGRSAA
jgi:hypothetical protein